MSAELRSFDGQPVYPRPAVGDLSPQLDCSCGLRFRAPCLGVQEVGDGDPECAMANCSCGSTRAWLVEVVS